MLLDVKAFQAFITATFPDVTARILNNDHIGADCPKCNRSVALNVSNIEASSVTNRRGTTSINSFFPFFAFLQCPICHSLAIWVLYRVDEKDIPMLSAAMLLSLADKDSTRIFRIASIPPEGLQEIPDLPEKPPTLRAAYIEAMHSLDNNCPMAAAAMFRRALQVITREILGAKPGTLASELNSLVGQPNRLGIPLSKSFENHSYIIKEIGNQAAHPDKDPDLLSFTFEDANDLHAIFLELVSELFVIPAAATRAKQALLDRRKITVKP